MCDSVIQGGQRCASQTGQALRQVEEDLSTSSLVSTDLLERHDRALVAHASTPTGQTELRKRLMAAHAERDHETEAQLGVALIAGLRQREVNSAVKGQMRDLRSHSVNRHDPVDMNDAPPRPTRTAPLVRLVAENQHMDDNTSPATEESADLAPLTVAWQQALAREFDRGYQHGYDAAVKDAESRAAVDRKTNAGTGLSWSSDPDSNTLPTIEERREMEPLRFADEDLEF